MGDTRWGDLPALILIEISRHVGNRDMARANAFTWFYHGLGDVGEFPFDRHAHPFYSPGRPFGDPDYVYTGGSPHEREPPEEWQETLRLVRLMRYPCSPPQPPWSADTSGGRAALRLVNPTMRGTVDSLCHILMGELTRRGTALRELPRQLMTSATYLKSVELRYAVHA